MIRFVSRPARRLSTQSYWSRFKDYKNTDSLAWAWMTKGQKFGVIGVALNEVFKSTNESRLSWDIFEDAKKKISDHELIKQIFGLPLKMYAQDSSDFRVRNSLGHSIQKERDGDRLWMSFVLIGTKGKGYVTVEKFKKIGSDDFEYVSLIVDAPFTHQSFAIIDNRPVISAKRMINVGERLLQWLGWSS